MGCVTFWGFLSTTLGSKKYPAVGSTWDIRWTFQAGIIPRQQVALKDGWTPEKRKPRNDN